MSHITSIQLQIKDLAAVKALCKEKGWEFKEGQTSYKWYGKFMGDAPIPEGMTVEDYGKCDHAIAIPGADYEIGLRKADNLVEAKNVPMMGTVRTSGYRLVFDSWRSGGLAPHIGQDGKKFLQGYGVCAAEMQAKRLGLNAKRISGKNGAIKVMIGGARL